MSDDSIRRWARENGFEVGTRGRLPKKVLRAWERQNRRNAVDLPDRSRRNPIAGETRAEAAYIDARISRQQRQEALGASADWFGWTDYDEGWNSPRMADQVGWTGCDEGWASPPIQLAAELFDWFDCDEGNSPAGQPAAEHLEESEPRSLHLLLTVGEAYDLDLPECLVKAGYERVKFVAGEGEFVTRGGILDVWPGNAPNAVRVEFDGTAVESIRTLELRQVRAPTDFVKLVAKWDADPAAFVDRTGDWYVRRFIDDGERFGAPRSAAERRRHEAMVQTARWADVHEWAASQRIGCGTTKPSIAIRRAYAAAHGIDPNQLSARGQSKVQTDGGTAGLRHVTLRRVELPDPVPELEQPAPAANDPFAVSARDGRSTNAHIGFDSNPRINPRADWRAELAAYERGLQLIQPSTAEIREWAIRAGLPVQPRRVMSRDVWKAYRKAERAAKDGIHDWAAANGFKTSPGHRVAQSVKDAYLAAHPEAPPSAWWKPTPPKPSYLRS